MKNYFKLAALTCTAAALVACGGGGGSPGTTQESYSITLRADKTQLPLNIQNVGAGQGAYAPFTTSLYVEAKKGSLPIPGGEDIFGCNVSGGLDSGSLYYLDGNPEHEEEIDDGNGGKIKVPLAYRSITLGANSGGNSFHFHAKNQAGTARITCTVTDPRDSRVHSASVDIVVGSATQKAASVRAIAQAPGYLGSKNNLANLSNNVAMEAFVMDDANQPIPSPSAANLQVSIRPVGAAVGARLISGSQSGSVLQVQTQGGVGLFSLSSGPSDGVIVLELTADRFDNNVSNGIQDPVASLTAVGVYHDTFVAEPLVITSDAAVDVVNSEPFAYALSAEGGVPPYTWSTAGGLPSGLTLGSSGIISGTPTGAAGAYKVVVRVTDSKGASKTSNMTLTLGAPPPAPIAPLAISGCTGDINTACALPAAKGGALYLYAFSATGGDATKAITWGFTGQPAWLTVTGGLLSGTPAIPGACATSDFLATATRDTLTVTRKVSINVCP